MRMLAPGGPPGAAAFLMAVEDLADYVGKVLAGGVFGFGMHRAGAIFVGQNHLKSLRGSVFGAAPRHMHTDVGGAVFVVGFAAEAGVEVGVVGLAAAAEPDVGLGAGSGLAEHGVGGVDSDTLSGMHGDRVSKVDVLA